MTQNRRRSGAARGANPVTLNPARFLVAMMVRFSVAATSQVQSLSYYIDLLHNGCSGDGTDLQGLRHVAALRANRP
jgi:hypothetical protein